MSQCTVSADQLRQLMEAAFINGRASPAFFRALIDATVHAYVPLSPPEPGRLQLIQLRDPDNGQWVVPFFTDALGAEVEAADRWRIISMPGRYFLELTRGSTLVVNPGDAAMMLHSTDVDALLTGQNLPAYAVSQFASGSSNTFSTPTRLALDLFGMLLTDHLANAPGVEAVYVAQMHGGTDRTEVALLVEFIAADERAVRLVQTCAAILQAHVASFPLPVRLICRRRDNALLAERQEARQIHPATT